MKIGVAISCYDKFDELELLIKMIRCWDGDYEIGLCCNHPDGEKYAKLVDYYIPGRDIPFKEGDSRERTFFKSQDDNYSIRVRAADCVRSVCWLMANCSKCDWVIHVHADAWFLSEEGLKNFINECECRPNCYAACRGTGLDTHYKPNSSTSAYGQADDHFFAFNTEFASIHNCWNYRPENLMMRKYSVHGLLMTIFAVKFGLENVWYYKKLNECLNCYAEPLDSDETKPCVYDPEYGFLHLHRGSLPPGWGKQLQAWFLSQCYDGYCIYVNKFISEHYNENILNDIRNLNTKLNEELTLRLYPKNIRLKNRTTYKELLCDEPFFKSFIKNIKKRMLQFMDNAVYPKRSALEHYKELNKGIDNDWTDIWSE